jgi:hypothetical protein
MDRAELVARPERVRVMRRAAEVVQAARVPATDLLVAHRGAAAGVKVAAVRQAAQAAGAKSVTRTRFQATLLISPVWRLPARWPQT